MPRKIFLSTMAHSAEGSTRLQNDLNVFGQQCGLEISFQELDYSTGWSDFMRMSIYGGSPDVSEIGTTWVNDFASMNTLRPFSPSDVRMVGNAEAFVPGVWKSGTSAGVIWAIPSSTSGYQPARLNGAEARTSLRTRARWRMGRYTCTR